MAVNATDAPGVTGMPKLLLRAEGVALFIGAVALFARLDAFSWVHVLVFVAPDLSFLAYLVGPRVGALVYNAAHTTVLPIVLGLLALISNDMAWVAIALVWLAHIGFDRLLGYGLKYPAGFGFTHLGPIKRGLG